jgi:hypothetical protein
MAWCSDDLQLVDDVAAVTEDKVVTEVRWTVQNSIPTVSNSVPTVSNSVPTVSNSTKQCRYSAKFMDFGAAEVWLRPYLATLGPPSMCGSW